MTPQTNEHTITRTGLEQITADIIAAMENGIGFRRERKVGEIIDGQPLTTLKLARLLVEVYVAGQRAGREQIKKDIANL